MTVLADTHAFLWFVFADPRLPPKAERTLGHRNNRVVLSTASLWEIASGMPRLPAAAGGA